MEPTTIAIDLAKRVFQIHYVEPETGAIHSKVFKRAQLVPFFANRHSSRVVMEACGSAHHWAWPGCWRGLATTCGSSQHSSCGHS
jgi:transposase